MQLKYCFLPSTPSTSESFIWTPGDIGKVLKGRFTNRMQEKLHVLTGAF